MTLSVPTKRQLSTDPPQNKEEAVFMFEVGEECRRRALRYLVEVADMSYGEIVKLAQQHNPSSKISKDTLKRLAAKMKADGEPLKTTKQPERLKPENVVRFRTTPVENSEPEIEQVTVTVDDPPTPIPTPIPSAPPAPAPASNPSVPSVGSSAPARWEDDPVLDGWNGNLNELGQQIYKREVASSRKRMQMAEQMAEFKLLLEKTMRAASKNHTVKAGRLLEADVKMVEAILQREGRPGIKQSLDAVFKEAERIQKYASETLRLLQLQEAPNA